MQGLALVAPDRCLLEAHHIRKSFPGVVALDDVSMQVQFGTVHAVMGENGAGKSTLMKIFAGIETPDAGELRFKAKPIRLASPGDALHQGIAMIHQELNLMPSMTVAENLWIGREPVNALGLISHRELRRRSGVLLEQLQIDIDPDVEVRTLPLASRQMIEIAKALSYEAELLIMDEPTSSLSERDAGRLFAVIRDLKGRGRAILYITHRMEELFEIADMVSVLRDGRHVGTAPPDELTRDSVIRMMVGRELSPIDQSLPVSRGAVALSVRSLSLAQQFTDINFDLHAGEILGIAGLIGSGRSKVAESLFGVDPATSGQILLDGVTVDIDCPQTAMSHGIAFLTEDRKASGCFLPLDVLENLQISVLCREFVQLGWIRSAALAQACEAMSRKLRVKTPDLHERVENLSGGNQQKVLIGRWLLTRPRILILDEPTRGIDVGAKAEIHQLIVQLAADGAAVLIISSELPEILALSHRIMVMRSGRISGILERAEADQVQIMSLAAQ